MQYWLGLHLRGLANGLGQIGLAGLRGWLARSRVHIEDIVNDVDGILGSASAGVSLLLGLLGFGLRDYIGDDARGFDLLSRLGQLLDGALEGFLVLDCRRSARLVGAAIVPLPGDVGHILGASRSAGVVLVLI